MKYANIAVDAPVDNTFDYHLPPELVNDLEPGHLVKVPFGTAMQHGIVLSLHDDTPIEKTKPIIERLDPRPVVTPEQIDLARWISRTTLAPIGLCLWMWLPPGLTGHQDIELSLGDEPATADTLKTDLERELVTIIKRRKTVRGASLNQSMTGKNWRSAADALIKAGVLRKTPILTPPRVKPKIIQTAMLAVHPNEIASRVRAELAQKSLAADLLETVAASPAVDLKAALKKSGAKATHAESLIADGLLMAANDQLTLAIPPEDVPKWLDVMRKVDKPIRILHVLARSDNAGAPLDVSWLYAQADCDLNDLKRLEEAELILLGEKQQWRDSLSERTFVAKIPPMLTPEQKAAGVAIVKALEDSTPKQTPPRETSFAATPRKRRGESVDSQQNFIASWNREFRGWSLPRDLYEKLKPLRRELRVNPTPAEDRLWQALRGRTVDVRFRRQHVIERFVVDFYCREARLVIEVDGGIHQYTQEEDAVRQAFLENLGLRVIRFSNQEVFQNLDHVLEKIRSVLSQQKSALTSGTLTPLPEFGSDHDHGGFAPLSASGEGSGVRAKSMGVGSDMDEVRANTTFLLHGVTGSGKTEIYLRAIERALELGRTALFLVPEIALTPQTLRRVAARFPGKVAVIHSGLSEGERYDTWRRARDGMIQVIVGARSALFAPLPNLGLIILDEMHDGSYKQSPPVLPPYYHARQVAEELIKRTGGVLIMGSATPDVETMYRAERGEIRKLDLPRRIMGHRTNIHDLAEQAGVIPRYQGVRESEDVMMIDLPPVQVIDMRDELKQGNTSIFSGALREAIGDVLERREQAILFLNRRGQATYVFCRDCGYVATCPRCDTPLTHHRTGDVLRCHRCGYSQAEPTQCPNCHSRRIKYFGAGTQQVEEALVDIFPRARVARWDADTADSPEAHEAILQRFIDRKTDVMIGTQMVAKGLDLPLVTLVGVVSADVGLNLPDFRAGERTFQLLTQVAGRAGRGLLGGQVILQTYRPEHYAISAASRHDFKAFYAQEIAYRRDMGYPPFRRLVRILFRFPTEMQAQAEADRAAGMLRNRLRALNMTGTELIGPAPCFFTRENKQFRWHVLLRGPDPVAALTGLNIPKGWHVDVDPVDIL